MSEQYKAYLDACHAVQTGVAALMIIEPKETSPKHLHVGVNDAMAGVDALAKLLIARGVFTFEEWIAALTEEIEIKAKSYADPLGG